MITWAIKHKQSGKYAIGEYNRRDYISSLELCRKYDTRESARYDAYNYETVVKVEVKAREL